MKATEPFVIVALILLVFALVMRFENPSGLGVSVTWRGTGYVLPPSFVCIALATMLCFVASIYSLWMLSFNRAAIETKMTRLARFLALPVPSFDAILTWVVDLRERLGIPHSLAAIGVDDRRSKEVARKAAADGNAPTNPTPVGAAELGQIFDQALRGAL